MLLSALASVLLRGGFLLFLLQYLWEFDQHYGSFNGCASVIYVLAHCKLLAKHFYLVRDSKYLIAYRLHLFGILHPTNFVPKDSTRLTQGFDLRIDLQSVLNEIILRFKFVLAKKLGLLRVHTGAANVILNGSIGFGVLGNDLRYCSE